MKKKRCSKEQINTEVIKRFTVRWSLFNRRPNKHINVQTVFDKEQYSYSEGVGGYKCKINCVGILEVLGMVKYV